MRLKLLITFSLFNILNGQENKNLNYKEDQIYFNFNFDFQLKSIEELSTKWFFKKF